MAERVRVRELRDDEGQRLLRILQGLMIRRYIAWRNRHADDQHLRHVIGRANVA